jgi:UDP-glucose 4-epimerase
MSRVLVTGATTPVGRALVEALLAAPDVEHVLAVGGQPRAHTLAANERLSYVHTDLTRPRSVRELLFGEARELGVEVVVHTALHRSARDEGRRMHRLNVESTRELLHLAERHPTIRRFVYRSYAEVYRVEGDQPSILDEEHPLDFRRNAPQRVRDRIEADVMVCTRMGLARLQIAVLREAEILAADSGSPLWDWLRAPICFRPLGYDPMVQLLSIPDAVRATVLAVKAGAQGVLNIAGADVLPLSALVRAAGRRGAAVPGPLLHPLYELRAWAREGELRYDLVRSRFHASAILDGRRAERMLGYQPQQRIDWAEVAACLRNGT